MTKGLQERIYSNLQTRPTAELVEVWEENDHGEWSDEAFSAIQEILQARLGTVPPQKPSKNGPDKLVELAHDDNRATADLMGGLSLIPYGLYAILSALAFAQGWLDWQTNGGPPALGLLAAWLVSKLINRHYRKRYSCSFDGASSNTDGTTSLNGLLVVLIILCFVAAWFVDARIHPPLRALPLLLGSLIVWRGVVWIRANNWPKYGVLHVGMGFSLIGLGLAPLILGVSSHNSYFGIDGILELALGGIATIVIGLIEHSVFLKRYEVSWKSRYGMAYGDAGPNTLYPGDGRRPGPRT